MIWRSLVAFCFLVVLGLNISHAFYDVLETDAHKPVFDHLRDVGVMKGFDDGNFYTEKNVSRAEALTIAMRAGKRLTGNFSGQTYFGDVNPNAWYAPVISQAVATGIVMADKDQFRPDQAVTKAEFLAFLFRSTRAPLQKYNKDREIAADIPNGQWFTEVFAYAKHFQIAHLPPSNFYYPEKFLTRREVAVMTYRQLRLMHGSEATGQVIELQAAISQFVGLIREERYEEAEFHLYNLITLSDKLIRTKNNQDSIAANALSQSMQHLSDSFRAFKYGKNLNAISSLHLALKQAERAGEKSEAMAPFANDLQLLIHQTLSSLTEPKFALES